MIVEEVLTCSKCEGSMKYYDSVLRIVRTKGRESRQIKVQRFQCSQCGWIHRNLPDYIFPYKQYEAEVIQGVLEGFITPETIGYEEYPCEMTMIRWKSTRKMHPL